MEEYLQMYGKILQNSRLFGQMEAEELQNALHAFRAHAQDYEKGGILHPAGTPLTQFGLVLSGTVQVCCDDLEGNRMLMANVTAGGTFGESLAYLQIAEPNVCIIAAEPVRVLWLSVQMLFVPPENAFLFALQQRFSAMLAARTLSMNDRIQVLSKLTLREKLLTYFSEAAQKSGSSTVTVPMNREAFAAYLGTNRSALSRVLSELRQEGILSYNRNVFDLHSAKFSE